MQDSQVAGRARGGTARRQGTKPSGGGSQSGAKKARVQFHLGEKLIERIGVHASLVHRNQSAVVEEILTSWLTRYGRGRELFPSEGGTSGGQVDPSGEEGSAN